MALRKLRLLGDDILRKRSKPVKEITKSVTDLLDDMAETLKQANGLGLAAPQVGVLKRIAIIDMTPAEDGEQAEDYDGYGLIELINPVIVETEGEQENSEACLSMPGKTGVVKRPAKVTVKALNRFGEEIIVKGDETLAIALCHELDHLDGVLYIDKADEITDVRSEG